MDNRPIGVYDSGFGGLSVWRELYRALPDESLIYLGDGKNCPYGSLPEERIREYAEQSVGELVGRGCKLIVVACNTASAAAIDFLRAKYPKIPFVGIEPAIKPAAIESKSGTIGVLATEGTFNGRLYNSTKEKFARGVTILAVVADEFVDLVEKGILSGGYAEGVVRKKIEPLLAAGCDRIVLGCTHFPHLSPLIAKVIKGRAEIVEPSQAVAEQTRRILAEHSLSSESLEPHHVFIGSMPDNLLSVPKYAISRDQV